MKTLRIRKFMVIGMVSVVIFPWFVYFFIHFNNPSAWQKGSGQNQAKLTETLNMIAGNSAKWTNLDWQKGLQQRLSQENLNAEILLPTNQEIFKSGNWHKNPWLSSQQTVVMENGRILGTVKLSSKWQNDAVAGLSALTALILAIFFVGYQMRRSVVKPLEAMSRAARRIAEGDLDISLPVSSVTEIAEVRNGFGVMVAGLRESFQQQAKLEEERRFFIGAIAHDLRTPLFALRGYLDGLEQGIASSPEQMEKYVAVCKEKANQLDRLVSDLFAFTKLEYMEQTLQNGKVDLNHLIEQSVDSLRPLAAEKGILITAEPTHEPCQVTGDSHLLERAMNNLLDNALRYTPSGGRIQVSCHKESGKFMLSVKDTGPGFAAEDLNYVFDLLYRGEVSRNRKTGGAGLGLTIARRIFKAHGGDLTAENAFDGGAVLTGWISPLNESSQS